MLLKYAIWNEPNNDYAAILKALVDKLKKRTRELRDAEAKFEASR